MTEEEYKASETWQAWDAARIALGEKWKPTPSTFKKRKRGVK